MFVSPDPYLMTCVSYTNDDYKSLNDQFINRFSDPKKLNKYSYGINNPLKYDDPSGLLERDKTTGEIETKDIGQPKSVKHPADVSPRIIRVQEVEVKADDGTKVQAFVNKSPDQRYDTDCHGTTFGDGKLWINNDQVPKILNGDKYKERTGSPQKGDVAIYKDSKGEIVHSATVDSVDKNTGEVKVKGLGGLETSPHTDKAKDAWRDPNITIKYYHK